MLFKRSMQDRFKGIQLKDLPTWVRDKVNNLSRILEISEGAVIHAMVTDWVAREVAEVSMLGKKPDTSVYPFQFDQQTNVILGDDLFRLLKIEHMRAMADDDTSVEKFSADIETLRQKIEKTDEEIEEKIDTILMWAYETTGVSRTRETDAVLSYMVLRYHRAGFSDDQVRELIAEESEYFKKEKKDSL